MGLASILVLVYGASAVGYHASLLISTKAMVKRIEKDGYVSTGKADLFDVIRDRIFSTCLDFSGNREKWNKYALIPGLNTLLAVTSTIMVIRNKNCYSNYGDLEYRGFITKDSDSDSKGTDSKDDSSNNLTTATKDSSMKKMTRQEVINALKAEREKISSTSSKQAPKKLILK